MPSRSRNFELELELIQTHMTQKPVLRVEVGARALRELIKNCGWTGRASAGVQGTRVWAWISGAPVRAGWVCDGGVQLSFCGDSRATPEEKLRAKAQCAAEAAERRAEFLTNGLPMAKGGSVTR